MNNKEVCINDTIERTNELLHMVLDLRMNANDVDLRKMQHLILGLYTDNIRLNCKVCDLERELERRKRTIIEVPSFVAKKKEAR